LAIRVRKLARELRKTPEEVLLQLHELGFQRFRTPQDMVGDAIANKVRKGTKTSFSRSAPQVIPPVLRRLPPASAVAPKDGATTMDQLVPGVVPQARATPTATQLQRELRAEAQRKQEQMDAERAELSAVNRTLDARSDTLDKRESELQQREQALVEAKASLEAEREQLQSQQASREVEPLVEVSGPWASLADVFGVRGLQGMDEQQRALEALAQARLLSGVLASLGTVDVEGLAALLRDQLVLVDGKIPSGMVGVTVAPDRAECPGEERLQTGLKRVGELFLLNGVRRPLVVGLERRWARLFSSTIDKRIELQVGSGLVSNRTVADAKQDVTRSDLILLWGGEPTEEARSVYQGSRCRWVTGPGGDFGSFLRWVVNALETL
jgi:hypothetical protein